MRTYDILILGIETDIGQQFYSLLCQQFQSLSVCVPLSQYSPQIQYPPSQVPINYSNKNTIHSLISSCKLIVCAKYKSKYSTLKLLAKNAFIDISCFKIHMMANIINNISNYNSENAEICLKPTFRNTLSCLFYSKPPFLPVKYQNTYRITIDNIYIENPASNRPPVTYNISISFPTLFFAYLFVIFGVILKPFIFISSLLFNQNISFNAKSIRQGDCTLQYFDLHRKKKLNIYDVVPLSNETAIILDFAIFNIINLLRMKRRNNYKYNSIKCQIQNK